MTYTKKRTDIHMRAQIGTKSQAEKKAKTYHKNDKTSWQRMFVCLHVCFLWINVAVHLCFDRSKKKKLVGFVLHFEFVYLF